MCNCSQISQARARDVGVLGTGSYFLFSSLPSSLPLVLVSFPVAGKKFIHVSISSKDSISDRAPIGFFTDKLSTLKINLLSLEVTKYLSTTKIQ